MRARSLALAALILAAPAPAMAASTPAAPAAESSPVFPVEETTPGTDPAPAAPTPAPEPQPDTTLPEKPADNGAQNPPAPVPVAPAPKDPQVSAPVIDSPQKPIPSPSQHITGTPSRGQIPASTGTERSVEGTAVSAAQSPVAPAITVRPQSTGIRPITSTLIPASVTSPAVSGSPIAGIHHYAAKHRVPLGTVTVKAAPKLGTVTVIPAKDANPAALWGLGMSAVVVLGAAFWANRRRAGA